MFIVNCDSVPYGKGQVTFNLPYYITHTIDFMIKPGLLVLSPDYDHGGGLRFVHLSWTDALSA